jgi:UDP-N-acetylmuramoyl-tripeptide--D-alanyl-D-alanine ligase
MTGSKRKRRLKTMAEEKTDITPLPFTGERIIGATNGEPSGTSAGFLFKGVSIDSRAITADDLFVAIRGENHDGHRFIPDLLEKGVKGFVIEQRMKRELFPAFKAKNAFAVSVDDTVKALGRLAASQKNEAKVRLIAVTGSNGKTSTRAMTSSVLETGFKVLATQGNFNNEIGLPLTLLRLGKGLDWTVAEMGMNAPGEIERLAAIAGPDIGIITNVAEAHLEGLGSIENVAKAKAELLDALGPDKTAILNADDRMFPELLKHCRCRVLTFGTSEKADVQAGKVRIEKGRVVFNLSTDLGTGTVTLNTPGPFMVMNALSAACAGMTAGLSFDLIKKGLESFVPVYGRVQVTESPMGFHLIDDTYNANPQSMMAAIDTLCGLKGDRPGYVILGDMKELGEFSDSLHRKIGAYAAEKKVDAIFTFGEKARLIGDEAIKKGFDEKSVFTGSKKEIIETISKKLGPEEQEAWVLVKGSRSMSMEEIVKDLLSLNGEH